jgi:peptidoglycan/LPS O-acetylase OafA/YrhL
MLNLPVQKISPTNVPHRKGILRFHRSLSLGAWFGRSPAGIQGKRVSDDLDLIRGMAAVAVLIYHVRYRFFYDYADVQNANWISKSFYGITSFGHDAVIVFFVLSGYFISASVLRDGAKHRWSWKRYSVSRLTRLYLVLIPGLLLTLFWDGLGLKLFPDSPVYTGAKQPWINDFYPIANCINVKTVAANAVFLQTVVEPPLGSNVALWSLSYEFWYYFLFPLAILALIWPTSKAKSLASLALVAILLTCLGPRIALYFPIWLLGAAVCILPPIRSWHRPHSVRSSWLAIGLFCSALAVTHLEAGRRLLNGAVVALDYVNGILFALVLYFLIHNQSPEKSGPYSRISRTLAGFSYTLYLVHLPLLVFLRAAFVREVPWRVNLGNIGWTIAISLGCVAYAYLISQFTEAKTNAVRNYVMARLAPTKTSVPTCDQISVFVHEPIEIDRHYITNAELQLPVEDSSPAEVSL